MPKNLNSEPHETLITVPEAAERLSVSPRTIRRLIAEGKIRAYQIRRAVRISESDLQAYKKSARI